MKVSLITLVSCLASASAWQYINVPANRPNNCGCENSIFCKVVYINPKTVNKASRSNGRITVRESKLSLDVTFDDLGEDIGAGVSGTLIEKDGRPYTVEPCKKNTDNERQFHRLIRQHLMVKTDAEPTAEERQECCLSAATCEGVDVNIDLFNQVSLENLYLETSLDPANYFDVNTAQKFTFKQTKKLSRRTKQKIYSNEEGQVLTLTTNGRDMFAVVTSRGSKADGEVSSVRQCGGGWFFRSAPQADFVPGARSGGDRDRDGPPPDMFGDYDERAVQGPDTCYFHNVYYCKIQQDFFVVEPIQLDANNRTDADGQDSCNTICLETPDCLYFTWTKFRDVQMCYLMNACLEDKKDPCLTESPQVCMSGPKECEPLENNTNCAPLTDHGPGYVDWQCRDFLGNDVEAYFSSEIPWGTVCVQSCDSWVAQGSNLSYPIEGHLVSKCENDGTWSETVAYDGKELLLFPPQRLNPKSKFASQSPNTPWSKYPVPNDPKDISLQCQCETLALRWPTEKGVLNNQFGKSYNPNTEDVTDFLCDYALDSSAEVVSNNTCVLFCDSYLTSVVRCWDGKWTGRPDLGFWCQNEPDETNGPTDTW